jgi:hypothetical protein
MTVQRIVTEQYEVIYLLARRAAKDRELAVASQWPK